MSNKFRNPPPPPYEPSISSSTSSSLNSLTTSTSTSTFSPRSNRDDRDKVPVLRSTASPTSTRDSYDVVVGVDFGTSGTGYAYQFRARRDFPVVIANTAPFNNGLKTPTDVLISIKDDSVIVFGANAWERYKTMDSDIAEHYLFFHQFKMYLYGNLTSTPMIKSTSGIEWEATRVFAACLRFISNHALKRIGEISPVPLTASNVLWVLTVPAIWSQGSKELMRKAAYSAGMISSIESRQLLLALEPEVASIRCRETTQPLGLASAAFQKGTRYILIDAGGGTVDSVVHVIRDNDGSEIGEEYKASGQNWGSTYIDKEYERLLSKIFGAAFMEEFKISHPVDYIELMHSWETQKIAVPGEDDRDSSDDFNCALPQSFFELLTKKKVDLKSLVHQFDSSKSKRFPPVGVWKKGLRLSFDVMLALFAPVIDQIVEHCMDLLKKVPDASYIFLVGGFADCNVLYQRIQKLVIGQQQRSKPPISVLRPDQPGLAVLAGSVRYGLKPPSFIRRMKCGYGTSLAVAYTEEHKRAGRAMFMASVGGIRSSRCTVYYPFVDINEEVSEGKVISHSFLATDDSTEVSIDVYSYSLPLGECNSGLTPLYLDSPGVEFAGPLSIFVGKSSHSTDRGLDVKMKFGGSEIEIECKHKFTGKVEPLKLQILDNPIGQKRY